MTPQVTYVFNTSHPAYEGLQGTNVSVISPHCRRGKLMGKSNGVSGSGQDVRGQSLSRTQSSQTLMAFHRYGLISLRQACLCLPPFRRWSQV